MIKEIYKGESVSFLLTFEQTYDMARIQSHYIYVGNVPFIGEISGHTISLQLKSNETNELYGLMKVVLCLDDSFLGVRKPFLFDLNVVRTKAEPSNVSTSEINDVIVPIVISETEITVDDVLYNYVKGDAFTFADFTPEQITELQAPALEAKEIVLETNENVTIAEGLRADSESARVTAEGLRVTNESSRVTVEGWRVTAEQDRVNAENIRVNAESTRVGNESIRVSQESARVAAEAARVAAGAEIQTNKTGDISGNSTSTTKYPTIKGLFDWVYSLFARKSCELSPVANTYLLFDYVNSHWQVTIPDGVKIVLKDADRLTASGIVVCVLSDNQINHLYYNTADNTIVASTTPTTKQPSTCYYFGSINTYTGAETINVNSPFYKINGVLTGSNLGSKIDSSNGFVGLTALKINFKNVANTFTSYFTNTNTASRTYTFPDSDGTVMVTDPSGFILNSVIKPSFQKGTGVLYNGTTALGGTNQGHTMPHNSNFDVSDCKFSMEWFGYVNTSSVYEPFFAKRASDSTGILFGKSTDNSLLLVIRKVNSSDQFFSHTQPITAGWNHVVAVVNGIGNNVFIYVNGRKYDLGGTQTLTAYPSNTEQIDISSAHYSAYYSNNITGIFRFYNYALTTQEVANMWNAGNPQGFLLPYAMTSANNTVISSGNLIKGKQYQIITQGSGDFSNVGASANTAYTIFTATATTPNSWGGSTLKLVGAILSLESQNCCTDKWVDNSNFYTATPVNSPIQLFADTYKYSDILSSMNLIGNSLDLDLPAGYYIESIQISNVSSALSSIVVTSNATGLDSQAANIIISGKTVPSGRSAYFTLLADQVIYSVPTKIRLVMSGNTSIASIIYKIKRQA